MSVTYSAELPVREETGWYLAHLLKVEQQRRGTRARSRVLGCLTQAVLVLRWYLDGIRMSQLVRDNKISKSQQSCSTGAGVR